MDYESFTHKICDALLADFVSSNQYGCFSNHSIDYAIGLIEHDGHWSRNGNRVCDFGKYSDTSFIAELMTMPNNGYRCTIEYESGMFRAFENYIGDGVDDQIQIYQGKRIADVLKHALKYEPNI